jgi:hypothetical protein
MNWGQECIIFLIKIQDTLGMLVYSAVKKN